VSTGADKSRSKARRARRPLSAQSKEPAVAEPLRSHRPSRALHEVLERADLLSEADLLDLYEPLVSELDGQPLGEARRDERLRRRAEALRALQSVRDELGLADGERLTVEIVTRKGGLGGASDARDRYRPTAPSKRWAGVRGCGRPADYMPTRPQGAVCSPSWLGFSASPAGTGVGIGSAPDEPAF